MVRKEGFFAPHQTWLLTALIFLDYLNTFRGAGSGTIRVIDGFPWQISPSGRYMVGAEWNELLQIGDFLTHHPLVQKNQKVISPAPDCKCSEEGYEG
jgi:hypothetical protein